MSASASSSAAATSPAVEKNQPSPARTSWLKTQSNATVAVAPAIARSSEGLVPPTEWPWTYVSAPA